MHLGIIMDGNRRRAKAKLVPVIAGHKAGANNVERIIEFSYENGVDFLTLWALSKDNFEKRSKEEVNAIIKLINNLEKYLDKAIKNNLKFETIGDIGGLPKESQNVLLNIKEKTKNNTGLTLTLALLYGGQDEIIRAIQKIANDGIDLKLIDKEIFRKYLDTSILPPIDLIIRTGGDIRHSGFLLFDSEYAEYYFSQKKWPEFDSEEFYKAINYFNSSKRNFGK